MSDIIAEIEVEGGKITRRIVKVPSKGEITKVMLVQTEGDKDGFEYAFYSASSACPPGIYEIDKDTVDPLTRESYLIGDHKSVESGQERLMKDDKPDTSFEGGTYRNRDNGGSQTNMLYQVYMLLQVPGSGKKKFHLAMTVKPGESS